MLRENPVSGRQVVKWTDSNLSLLVWAKAIRTVADNSVSTSQMLAFIDFIIDSQINDTELTNLLDTTYGK